MIYKYVHDALLVVSEREEKARRGKERGRNGISIWQHRSKWRRGCLGAALTRRLAFSAWDRPAQSGIDSFLIPPLSS